MTLDDDEVDRRLAKLRGAAEAATANLIELEDLGTLSLLRAGDYTGASAEPIAAALTQITALNLHYSCFMRFVKRAQELRDDGRFTREKSRQIERLLNTKSITLPAKETDLEDRQLFSPTEEIETVTPDQLVHLMNDEFVAAKKVVFEVDGLWRELLPVLAKARGRIEHLRTTAETLGEDLPELGELESRVAWCHDAVATDPLGVGTNVAANIDPTLDALEKHVHDVAAARHGLAGQLAVARQQLDVIVTEVAACDEARAEARRSVVDPEGLLKLDHRYLDDERTGLAPWLDRLDDLQNDGRWRDAEAGLRRWTEQAHQVLETARKAAEANRGPVDRRNELRGMLSAYQALARREAAAGSGADPEINALERAARDNLFGAETDLQSAATQVREYQEAVRKRTQQ